LQLSSEGRQTKQAMERFFSAGEEQQKAFLASELLAGAYRVSGRW
jgi:hypothetical protein